MSVTLYLLSDLFFHSFLLQFLTLYFEIYHPILCLLWQWILSLKGFFMIFYLFFEYMNWFTMLFNMFSLIWWYPPCKSKFIKMTNLKCVWQTIIRLAIWSNTGREDDWQMDSESSKYRSILCNSACFI